MAGVQDVVFVVFDGVKMLDVTGPAEVFALRPPRAPALRAVVDLVAAQPADPHTATSLAATAGITPRHLARLFRTELGTSPARFVEDARLDHAKRLLDAGHGVAEAARGAGFGSTETMRRRFVARLGVAPSRYRARFGTTGPGDGRG